jgi:NAD(P)H-nitrite reductase large subunit
MSDNKTYLCRCEDLTLEDLEKLIEEGYTSFEEIKRKSRCTMGPCQGRTCRELIEKELAKRLKKDISEIKKPTYRAPVKPIKLGEIAGGDDDA